MRLAVAIFVGCFLMGIGKFQENDKQLLCLSQLATQVLYICVSSWVLADKSSDLFPAEKKITVFKVFKPEQIYKTDNIFHSKLVILSDNVPSFLNCLSFCHVYFLLSLTFNSQRLTQMQTALLNFSLIYDLIVANGWSHSHFGNSSDFGLNSLAGIENSRFGNAHACNQICGCSSKCIGKIS